MQKRHGSAFRFTGFPAGCAAKSLHSFPACRGVKGVGFLHIGTARLVVAGEPLKAQATGKATFRAVNHGKH